MISAGAVLILLAKVGIVLVACKAIIIGSEFRFDYWVKYGSTYVKWYHSRPDFIPPKENK
jgi:hypothetical protein